MKWTESEIQGLKAQEAKDLAVELLHKLQAKDKAPISPGEVQLKELQYELKLKEAEAEDNRQREEHERKIKELELQIESERARQAEAANRADAARSEHAALLEKVRASEESLSLQLERARREHNLHMEQLQSEYAAKSESLGNEIRALEEKKAHLSEEISSLSDLREAAEDVGRLREEIESRKKTSQQELGRLEEELETSVYEKTKKIKEVHRQQELELAQLDIQHKKQVLEESRKAADEILAGMGLLAVSADEWERTKQAGEQTRQQDEQQLAAAAERAKEEIKKQYNITTPDVIDVTDLFYRHQATVAELRALRSQSEKVDGEIRRMREHIEHEPQRIAAAVEAAKVHVQNTIEQARNR